MATQATITGTVNRVTQIGLETVPGTPVAAPRRLQAGGFDIARESEFQNFRPPGFKFDTQSAKTREWASGSYTGGLAYNEFHILCSSALKQLTAPTGTQAAASWTATTPYKPGDMIVNTTNRFEVTAVSGVNAPWFGTSGGTLPTFVTATPNVSTTTDATVTWTYRGPATGTGQRWLFDMNTTAPDTVQYFTIERGDNVSGRVRQASRARLTGLSVASARTGEVEVGADVVAGALVPKAGGLTSPTEVTMIPATPSQLNIYIDTDSTTLGNTQVQGNTSADFSISDRASAAFFHGRQIPGIANFVEPTGMGAEANLTQKDDDLVDELLLALQNGQQRFIRYEFLGPEIATSGVKYKILIDMCAQIGDSDTESDEDGVFSIELPYRLQHNGVWGKALQITVINSSTLLTN